LFSRSRAAAIVRASLVAAIILLGQGVARADDATTIPQIVNGSLSILFQDGVPAGTVATVTTGSFKATTKIAAAEGGLNVVTLNTGPQTIDAALESGQTVVITLQGPNSSAEWKIEPIINFMTSPPPFLPAQFNGGADTSGTGTLTASPNGAHAQITFTAEKHNYVAFPVSQVIPADTVALGGIVRPDTASAMGGLLSLRVQDATGEILGYSCHGSGLDDYTAAKSSPLTQTAYRFGGPASPDGKPKTGLPVAPVKIIGLLLEPGQWQWAGSMSAYITDVYAIRQISSRIAAVPASVVVRLDKPVVGNKSMSGFIGQGEALGSSSMMAGLHPQLWRLGGNYQNDRDRVKALGAPIIVVLSDLWGYQHSNPPNKDWEVFNARVGVIASDWKGYDTIWDLWNEPDNTGDQFAPSHDITDFYAIYNHAYHALRDALGPDVPIEGPSYALYSLPKIRAFLDYCVANNLQVNDLSWHELDKDSNTALVARDLGEVKELLAENPKYQALKIHGIQINETVGQTAQYRPGEIISYLYYLEQGGADGACKGCWWDSKGAMNCFNRSIDGILDPATNKPRAAYWAYALYSTGAADRVQSSASDLRLAPIASDTDGAVQVLIGNHAVDKLPETVDAPKLTIAGFSKTSMLRGAKQVAVTIKMLPDSGEAVLDAPVPMQTFTSLVTNDAVTIPLPSLPPHTALAVDISRA
jgi:xylan 1,4-beta-xylosidase